MNCRWCGQPIRATLGAWVHDVVGGAFYCRAELVRIDPPPAAEPDSSVLGPAIGRHRVDIAAGTAARGKT
jgi:hypothetical protein